MAVTASIWDSIATAASPAEMRPRLVPNIETAEFKSRAGAPYIVLRNPATNSYLKVEPRDYAIALKMDGTRNLSQLVLEDFKLHKSFAPPRVTGLVQLLRQNNFLTEPPLDVFARVQEILTKREASTSLRRATQGFLFTDFSTKSADKYLGKFYDAIGRLLFTRPGLILLALLAIAAPLFFWLESQRGRYSLTNVGGSALGSLVLLFVLGWIVIAIHELGHGMVVKHAGRYVPRAGFLIYYGFPAAFVDTSDIWMTPPRMRMAASLAGPLTGFFIGGVCAIAAYFLPTSPLGAFLFAFGFVALLNNLFNFNPLLELDGYYLLVDLIEKPMLRTRALGFVRGPLWGKLRRREKLTREEWFFTLFGFAAALWSVLALYLALSFWANQVQGPLVEAWERGDIFTRGVLILLGAFIAIPFLFAGLELLRWARARGELGLRYFQKAQRIDEAHDVLHEAELWNDLPDQELERVAKGMRAHTVATGKEVVRQGQTTDRYYLIAQGEFEVVKDNKSIKRLQRGDSFGTRALLDQGAHAASVIAATPGRLYSLDAQTFRDALSDDLERTVQLEAAFGYRAELGHLPLFTDLTTQELRAVLKKMSPVTFEKGTIINSPDVIDERFFIVRAGRVELIENGNVAAIFEAGDAYGEASLIENVSHTATLRTVERTEVLALNATDFRELLEKFAARPIPAERVSDMQLHTHKRLDEIGRR